MVKKTLSGDKAAFNQLVAKYQTQVYGFAFNISRNFSDAEDLAQEAFLRAYLSLHQLREPAKFGNWLYKITQNICRRWLQKKTNHEEITRHIRMNRMKEHVPAPDELAEAKELQKRVRNAIDELPEQERLVVTLYYMDGLTQRDIADFVGVSESTVKRRLRSSKMKLKGELLIMVQENLQKQDLTSEFTDKVAFKIESLETAIRNKIGKPEGAILKSDLEGLTRLDTTGKGIPNLSGIEHCANMQTLYLESNQIIEISPLSNMTKLEVLWLEDNQISDINPLSKLTNLQELYLMSNQITDISPLKNLTKLWRLWLWENQIMNISPLSKLTNLQDLDLHTNQISDISPLSNLTNLRELWLVNNQMSDISPLGRLTELKELYLSNNQIKNISSLSSLTNLQGLALDGNQISDISPLSNLTNLQALALGENKIKDISPLTKLTDIRVLYLDSNQITDISPLAVLREIGEDVALALQPGEKGEIRLHLGLSNNQIADINPLMSNSGIGEGDGVDLRGNPLNDEAYNVHIPILQKRGVKVLFDPKP